MANENPSVPEHEGNKTEEIMREIRRRAASEHPEPAIVAKGSGQQRRGPHGGTGERMRVHYKNRQAARTANAGGFSQDMAEA